MTKTQYQLSSREKEFIKQFCDKHNKNEYTVLIEFKDVVKLQLDNDVTLVTLKSFPNYCSCLESFKEEGYTLSTTDKKFIKKLEGKDSLFDWLGWSDGVFNLLAAIGIEAEGV
jgi:hypothetical protein